MNQPTLPNNSASRIARIFSNVSLAGDNEASFQVWGNELIIYDSPRTDDYEVITLVQALRKEIGKVESALKFTAIPSELSAPYFQTAYMATEVKNLGAAWKHFSQRITPDILLFFNLCAYALETNEPSFDVGELEKITEELEALMKTLGDAEISQSLREFVEEQVNLINQGLAKFEINGGTALKKCYVEGFAEIIEHADIIEENSDQQVVGSLRKIWSNLQKATTKAAATNKSIDTWMKVLEKGNNLIESLGKLSGGA